MKRKITVVIILLFFYTHLFSQCYTIDYISYNPNAFSGTIINSLNDDQYSDKIVIGFPFCFYGAVYTKLLVGTNGLLCFDTTKAWTWCSWPINSLTLPSVTSEVKNSIYFPWNDLSKNGGTFRYSMYGTAPNRTFVVTADSIGFYGCATLRLTSQVILYETTNVIEIYVHNKPVCATWNGGRAILGVQNSLGNLGMTDTIVTGTTSVTDIGVRFTPSCNVCLGIGIEEIDSKENDMVFFPNPATSELVVSSSEFGDIESIEIYSSLGEKRLTLNPSPKERDFRLDVSFLPSGIYFITVTDQTGNKVTRKVVKL